MRTRFKILFNVVKTEYTKAEKAYKNASQSALEIAKSASLSPSQAGDRYHSQGSADLTKEKFENITCSMDEIKRALEEETPEFTEAPCFIKTDKMEVYLLNNPLHIPDLKIVSSNSPLGGELCNRQKGDLTPLGKILEVG